MEEERRLSLFVRSNWTRCSISLISGDIVDDRSLTVGGRPGLYGMRTHWHMQWYGGRHLHPNSSLRKALRLYQHELQPCKRRSWSRPSAPSRSVSPKDVHGMWITMWMNSQCDAAPWRLTHCPIHRQHNPCNYIEMYFFKRRLYEG